MHQQGGEKATQLHPGKKNSLFLSASPATCKWIATLCVCVRTRCMQTPRRRRAGNMAGSQGAGQEPTQRDWFEETSVVVSSERITSAVSCPSSFLLLLTSNRTWNGEEMGTRPGFNHLSPNSPSQGGTIPQLCVQQQRMFTSHKTS